MAPLVGAYVPKPNGRGFESPKLQCRHVATGLLVHENENLTGRDGYVSEQCSAPIMAACVYAPWGVNMCVGLKHV